MGASCDRERIVCVVPRARIETRAGISRKGGIVHDLQLASCARKIVENYGSGGPTSTWYFKTETGAKFFEINLRFSGSLPLSTPARVHYPFFLSE